jgi:hypothetical protein
MLLVLKFCVNGEKIVKSKIIKLHEQTSETIFHIMLKY